MSADINARQRNEQEYPHDQQEAQPSSERPKACGNEEVSQRGMARKTVRISSVPKAFRIELLERWHERRGRPPNPRPQQERYYHRQTKSNENFKQASTAPDCAMIFDPPVYVENRSINPGTRERIGNEEFCDRIARAGMRESKKEFLQNLEIPIRQERTWCHGPIRFLKTRVWALGSGGPLK